MKNLYWAGLVCLSIAMLTSTVNAAKIQVVPDVQGDYYRGIYTVKGEADLPYPIQSDRLNQMMGKRLAVYNGYLKFLNNVHVLIPYLDEIYHPRKVKNFIAGAYVDNAQLKEKKMMVDIQYLFVMSAKQFKDLKKSLGKESDIEIEEIETFVKEKSPEQGFEISEPYWEKLVTFADRMSDDD